MATTTTATTTSLANKRGHKRSVSLENTAPPLMLRSTPSLCNVQQQQQQQQQQHHQQLLQQQSYHQQQQQQQLAGHTGTLKSRNEQRRFNHKYGSHNNLDDDNTQQGRTKFQNIRQMFELSRDALTASTATATSTPTTVSPNVCVEAKEMQSGLQSLPTTLTKSFTNKADQQQHKLPQSRKITTTATSIAGCGSNVDYQAHLNISETRSQQLQHQSQLQSQSQSLSQPPSLSQSLIVEHTNNVHHHNNNNNNNNINNNEINDQSTGGFLRPIAFKPIPFEPDYRISNHHHYCEVPVSGDRYGYGSTPSLVPVQTSSLKFGSTTDLRHVGGGGVGGSIGTASNGIMKGSLSLCTGVGGVGGGFGGVGGILSASSSVSSGVFVSSIYASHNNNNNINNNYCNSLMARRRGFKTLKSNDSMESIGQMTELDASMHIHSQNPSQSQCGNNSKTNANANVHGINGVNQSNAANIQQQQQQQQQQQNGNNKYMLSAQCELTPSPSDSGISELEAALKDRDSELSYLRQTMEHNEKDKETYWENETKRLKHFYEAQQREYLLKLKKMEQMLALQQFQLKQHKLRHGEQVNKLREQVADLKNELEILRNGNDCLRNSEHNLKETVAYLDKQLADAHNVLAALRTQLEDSEWKVCERNGEIALLKTQLKEANIEITIKDHAIVNLKHEHNNAETQMYQSLHEKNQQRQQQQQQQRQQQQQQLPKQIKTQTTPSNNMNNNDYVCADEQQLSKIIMLKDQVIVALTAELAKLRKELSDLAIAHEYGEEPCGRYTRLKQQLDNLNEICLKTRKYTKQMPEANYDKLPNENNNNNNINNNNDNNKQLDAFMQRLKLDDANLMDMSNTPLTTTATATAKATPASVIAADMPQQQQKQPQQQQLETSKSDDVKNLISKLESSTLDTLIEESTTYAEDIAKLRQKLDDFRINLELERRQWCAEKDKVLNYQKQLQANYINMYQKLRCLDSAGAVNVS